MKLFINIFMNGKSLEDTIRAVHQQHKNKPSPLKFVDPEQPLAYAPQQVTPKTDARGALTQNFKPENYRIF
jgi:hypothetical protein